MDYSKIYKCNNLKEFINCQKYLFRKKHYWYKDDKKIFKPEIEYPFPYYLYIYDDNPYLDWDDGIVDYFDSEVINFEDLRKKKINRILNG